MEQYSSKVMEHFAQPHNVGEIENADGVGTVGNPVCGDVMRLYIKVENNIITDAKFKTFGCGLDLERIALAGLLVQQARADRDDFAFLRLFLGGLGDDDAAGGLGVFLDAADDHAVAKGTELHACLS